MLNKIIAFLILLTLNFIGIVYGNDKNIYFDRCYCYTLTKPESWYFAKIEDYIGKPQFVLKDKVKEKQLNESTDLPSLIIIRDKKPHDGYNPKFTLHLLKWKFNSSITHESILQSFILASQKYLDEFEIIEDIKKINISSYDAFSIKYKYLLINTEEKIKVNANMIVINKKHIVYIIQTLRNSEDKENTEKEFESIIKSIKFDICTD